MEFVGGLLMVLALLGWLASIAGLVRPSLLAVKGAASPPTRGVIVMGMISLFAVFAVGATLLPSPKAGQVQAEPNEQRPKPALDISLSEWVDQMNAGLKELEGSALTVSTEKKKCDIWCVTTYASGEFVGYQPSHRDGRINEITMLAFTDGTARSGADVLLGLVAMMRVLSGESSKQKIPSQAMALLNEVLDVGESEVRISDVRYIGWRLDKAGLFVIASK